MLNQEKNYDFRKRLLTVHKKGIREEGLTPNSNEFEIKEGFSLVVPRNASQVILTAAEDFRDYLSVSMNVSSIIGKNETSNSLIIKISECQEEDYIITVDNNITVSGKTDRAIAQGLYCLEDVMNVRKAPFIKKETVSHTFMFSPRMVHPGYGVDMFPDEHLSQIAHAGMDAVLVFVKSFNETPAGFLDFNDLIDRAEKFGIDVYAYSYIKCTIHPDEDGVQEVYDSLYGEIFRQCPRFKGLVLVGENVYFDSKDKKTHLRQIYGQNSFPSDIPHPGFWPCVDYPEWLEVIKKSVYKYNKDADIVFWTYNWGSAPTDDRLALINTLPEDVSLLVTYEMYEICQRGNVKEVCSDYTLSFAGPGYYFKTEAEAAKKRGIKLYAMANTGGLTWDFGMIPYEPMPYQWIKRYEGLRDAQEKWGLCGLMESHHFGFFPSFIGDLSKLAFIKELNVLENSLEQVICAWFGGKYTDIIKRGLSKWSEAINHYVPTDDDQYGAFRVGPAYPFCLIRLRKPPSVPGAHFGNGILNVNYPAGYGMASTPPTGRGMLSSLRIAEEIKSLQTMLSLMVDGIEFFDAIPENERNQELSYLINLGKYICCCVRTGINAKEWYRLKNKLLSTEKREEVQPLVNKAKQLLLVEKENAEEAIDYVRLDSRLGWEPSMDYLGDEKGIRWKIDFIDYVINVELKCFENASDEKWLIN